MEERTPRDATNWNSLIGKHYYQKCPDDQRLFRSIRVAMNPFTGDLTPQISNPIYGTPPDELEPIPPLLLSRLLRIQMSSRFC